MEDWINISSQFPPELQWIQIFNEHENIYGVGIHCARFWFFNPDYTTKAPPTHWKELDVSYDNLKKQRKQLLNMSKVT